MAASLPPAHPDAAAEAAVTVLITGAAGDLGGLLARHLVGSVHRLRLMTHKRPLAAELRRAAGVTEVRADLSRPATLTAAVAGADVVVHFAGVLFAPRPERFLHVTNVRWFANLLEACLAARVSRLILISFPHVEGETTPDDPATGRLDRLPSSVHAQTRLAAERLLLDRARGTATTPVVLRLGMLYGRGLRMIEAARWLARRRLLAVWREPTWIHLLSIADFLAATTAAITRPAVEGIYHLGDEQPLTLQRFLDEICRLWGLPPPRRLPLGLIYTAARLCELFALATRLPAPLTRDFVTIGRASYCGDTRRSRAELLPVLEHPSLASGLATLR